MSATDAPFKTVRNQDGGGNKEIGGDDFDRVSDLLNGVPNVAKPKINSDLEIRYRRLFLRNEANSASVNLSAGAVTTNVLLTTPAYNFDDEITTNNAPQRLKGKTLSGIENTFLDIDGGGVVGRIQSPRAATGGSTGEGVLQGYIVVLGSGVQGVSTGIAEAPHGHHHIFSTGTTINNTAGIRYPDNTAFVRPDFNPWIRFKFRVPLQGGNHQLLVGLSTDSNITQDQDVLLSSQSGIMVGYRHTPDTGFMTFRNSGSTSVGSTPTTESTGAARGTALREVEIQFTNGGQAVTVTIRNPVGNTIHWGPTTYTTNIPLTSQPMYPVFQITNRNSANHDLFLHRIDFKQAY